VKLWHIPEKGLEESLCNAECIFSHKQRRVETVCFHPTADCLLTTTSYTTLTLWDISSEKEMLCKCYRIMSFRCSALYFRYPCLNISAL